MGDATNSDISMSRTRSSQSTNSLTNSLYELTYANSIVSASHCSWKFHPTNSEYLNLTNSLSRTHSNERNHFCTQVFGKSLLIEIPSHELYIGLLYIGSFYWSLIYASFCVYIYISLFIEMGLFFTDVRLFNMKILTLSQPHELTQLTDSHELNRPSHRSLQVSANGPRTQTISISRNCSRSHSPTHSSNALSRTQISEMSLLMEIPRTWTSESHELDYPNLTNSLS